MLVAALPLMSVIALLVKLTSSGPVLYTQARVGVDRRWRAGARYDGRRRVDLGGQPFRIYKFRTMYDRRGLPQEQVWTRPNDGRVTRVGRFLRSYRLDEFPQLANVLKGDMNLVGPRPEQPEIFARLRRRFDRFPERQRTLPGITGLAQVNCGYGISHGDVERKLECDLEYLSQRSLMLDLEILARTVPVVMKKKGAL